MIPLDPLAHEAERPRLGIVVVVAGVPEHEECRLPVQTVERLAAEAGKRVAEVGAAMVINPGVAEGVLDGPLHRERAEGVRHLGDLRDEREALHLREAVLQVPDELEHEARGVPHRVRDVAERHQPRLLAVASPPTDVDRHASVLEVHPKCPLGVELSLLLAPLAESEGVLDLPGQTGDDRLHLRHLVGREREERLVGQELLAQTLPLPLASPVQFALDVLADQAAKRLHPELHVGPKPREGAGIEAVRLRLPHERFQVRFDRLPRELVPDAPREVPDLEEVEEPLEADRAPALTYGHLERGRVGRQEHLGEGIDIEVALRHQPLEKTLGPGILAPQ